jgi:hypothetical protein
MSKSKRSRRIIALIAAYVVALQALLLPLSVAAASPFESSLCAAAASVDHEPSPAGHDSGCPCAAGCGTQCSLQTFVSPTQTMVAFDLTRVITLAPAPAIEPVIRVADRNPQVPRAPPAV